MDQRSGSDVNQNASSKSYTDEVYASLLDVTEVRLLSLLVKYLTGRSCYFPDSPHQWPDPTGTTTAARYTRIPISSYMRFTNILFSLCVISYLH